MKKILYAVGFGIFKIFLIVTVKIIVGVAVTAQTFYRIPALIQVVIGFIIYAYAYVMSHGGEGYFALWYKGADVHLFWIGSCVLLSALYKSKIFDTSDFKQDIELK